MAILTFFPGDSRYTPKSILSEERRVFQTPWPKSRRGRLSRISSSVNTQFSVGVCAFLRHVSCDVNLWEDITSIAWGVVGAKKGWSSFLRKSVSEVFCIEQTILC